uniref:Uncharacterized protein n=1 Tax=Ananas comosus var. bracteatus TaxID=296719 RepID=A0A6V7PWX1_ANACO|nr:unnamed protein product [Ananas comosus var. bracteatus]
MPSAVLVRYDKVAGGELELGRFSSSTSRRGAVQAYVCRRSIVRRPGESVIPPFSTSRRVGFSYRVVDGGPGFDRSDIRLCRGYVTSEIRLHTRLGRAHECRSGVWFCAFALMSLIKPSSSAAAAVADSERDKGVAS